MAHDPHPAPAEAPENPILRGRHSYDTITDKIASIVLTARTPRHWYVGASIAFCGLMLYLFTASVLVAKGIGVWGNNVPVAWALDIINFVWWIGIGHAGTLISAILLLMKQEWRTSINRFAEAMTIFAVVCAGLYPLLHLGRVWVLYWLMPYPNTFALWPQFRSPLVWDVFAVSTYALVSLIFWFVGLIPDLATLRDRAKTRGAQVAYGFLAMGWRNSAKHWSRYETMYLILAALSAPLVLSVHSIVSFDFAVSLLPGWHATIFPPYFVAGAVFAGFAMVLTLCIPLRKWYRLEDLITDKHLDYMGRVMLATGLIVVYGYAMEAFMAWYSGSPWERFMMINRMLSGPYAYTYWLLLLCNFLAVQFLWMRSVRHSPAALFVVSMFVNVGMWLERFVIIVTSLHRDFLPSSWDMYHPTFWDSGLFVGSIGLFLTLMYIFIRLLPAISIFEVRDLVHKTRGGEAAAGKKP
ncbi:MAG: polysulfide reductase NrfD [Verrucomicrobia bacterium]|nr:polysulfide reductase NrfD [Verrucomicrobiota bacterium]